VLAHIIDNREKIVGHRENFSLRAANLVKLVLQLQGTSKEPLLRILGNLIQEVSFGDFW
jgi:hypothetical protein